MARKNQNFESFRKSFREINRLLSAKWSMAQFMSDIFLYYRKYNYFYAHHILKMWTI